jgi:hypothetical protein
MDQNILAEDAASGHNCANNGTDTTHHKSPAIAPSALTEIGSLMAGFEIIERSKDHTKHLSTKCWSI